MKDFISTQTRTKTEIFYIVYKWFLVLIRQVLGGKEMFYLALLQVLYNFVMVPSCFMLLREVFTDYNKKDKNL